MTVYAEPGVAKESFHCPIKLTGIDSETTIYINRPPPPPPSSNSFDKGNEQKIILPSGH